MLSVHPLAAVHGAAVARDLVLVVLEVELVVVAELLPFLDPAAGADDDFVSSLEGHHFGHTVRRTRMVDVSRGASRERGVNHVVAVHAEHVHAAVLKETGGVPPRVTGTAGAWAGRSWQAP